MLAEFILKYGQFLVFVIIGIVNTLIHGSILVVLVEYFDTIVVFAHLIAFFAANLFSYIANSKFTFKEPLSLSYYYRFLMASMLALGLTLLISALMENMGFHYLIGFLMIIIVVPIFTFLTLKFWAFAKKS